MRASILALLTLGPLQGCTVSETALAGTRCSSTALCPSDQACYREFCISVEVLAGLDLDAAAGTVLQPPAAQDGDGAVPLVDVAPPGDGGAILSDLDAASKPGEIGPGSGMLPTVDTDSGPAESPDSTVPIPGVPAVDASIPDTTPPGSSPLVVCLASCAVPSPVCTGCVRGVLAVSPNACSRRARHDPTVEKMCEPACTAPFSCNG